MCILLWWWCIEGWLSAWLGGNIGCHRDKYSPATAGPTLGVDIIYRASLVDNCPKYGITSPASQTVLSLTWAMVSLAGPLSTHDGCLPDVPFAWCSDGKTPVLPTSVSQTQGLLCLVPGDDSVYHTGTRVPMVVSPILLSLVFNPFQTVDNEIRRYVFSRETLWQISRKWSRSMFLGDRRFNSSPNPI